MNLVTKINSLSKLSEEAAIWIEKNKEEMSFKKNETILELQQTCQYLYYLKSGMVCGYYLQNGEESRDGRPSIPTSLSKQTSFTNTCTIRKNCHLFRYETRDTKQD